MLEENKNKEIPDVSIIVVGMNHLEYLKDLFKSLYIEHVPKVSFELIYVDNCSKDNSVSFIKENYRKVKILENKKPLGFGENNNNGATLATGRYIAIINPDVIFKDNSLDNIYHFAEKINIEAVIAPKLLNPDESWQLSVREYMTPLIFLMRIFTKGNDNTNNKIVKKYLCTDIDADKIQTVDWAIGAALFIKRSLFEKLGGFDTSYFLYFEDVDLCARSWKLNAPVIYFPKSMMIHNHLRASNKLGKKTTLHIQSMIKFFLKHGLFLRSIKHTFHIEDIKQSK